MLQSILERFDQNIARVENLKSIYGPAKPGRRKVQDTDILRAALVLLHATLEDFLRSLQIWKIPSWDASVIGKFPLAGTGPKRFEKFGLGDLLPYRGSTVEELIKQSVSEQLNEFASFNDVGQVKDALVRSGIAKATLDAQEFGSLAAMITRRHNIVHKADRNDQVGGQGNHPTKSIEVSHLDKYLIAVKSIRDLVAAELI